MISRKLSACTISLGFSLAMIFTINGCAFNSSGYFSNTQEGDHIMDYSVLNPEGGFEIQPLKDYVVKMGGGTLSMFPEKGDRQSGPGMYLTGEKHASPVDLNTAVSIFKNNEPSYVFSDIKNLQIDSIPAQSLDFTMTYRAVDGIILENPGANEGDTIHGRVVIAIIQGTRVFKCVMIAPEKTWKSHEPVFMAALQTVKFIR